MDSTLYLWVLFTVGQLKMSALPVEVIMRVNFINLQHSVKVRKSNTNACIFLSCSVKS